MTHCVFFLIVTPGFESLAERELSDWLPGTKGKVVRGGIELDLPLAVGLKLNRALKIPTRILVRLADYGCRDFPKLYKKMMNYAWHEWVTDQKSIVFQASSVNSRLRIKKRIEETCADGRKAYLKKKAAITTVENEPLSVYVRFENDICTVSLDTSGEILHKRGLRPLSSEAPLRETMAAALLRFLEQFAPVQSGGVELIDPMTGGGTFLLEAQIGRKLLSTRTFAYERFIVADQIDNAELVPSSEDRYVSFVGFEESAKVLEAARENSALLGDKRKVQLINADFLQAEPLPVGPTRWLIANPPYGERLRIEGPLAEYYQTLFTAAERVVRPELSLFILPEKVTPKKLKIPPEWKYLGSQRFLNGGLPVVAVVYGRK